MTSCFDPRELVDPEGQVKVLEGLGRRPLSQVVDHRHDDAAGTDGDVPGRGGVDFGVGNSPLASGVVQASGSGADAHRLALPVDPAGLIPG